MARLNDASAPVDPVELLRRKYSRQNKEIARINSTQGIRIRNLENEVSRSLAENLALREQIIRLQSEAESKRAERIWGHVSAIKSNLEAKLVELGALVTTLGDEPPSPKRTIAKEGKHLNSIPTQSPDQRNWKNVCSISEAAGLQDGRLPPILEDKSYPRRTLEPAEIIDTLSDPGADNTESPDIGPPPVSKFINEDPVKIDLPPCADINGEDTSATDTTRSIHLEQRRKRRDSTGPSDRNRSSRFEPNPNQSGREIAQSLKTGAKRKLSSRDDDEITAVKKVPETSPDDFKYTRRNADDQLQNGKSSSTEKQTSKAVREFAVARGISRERTGPNESTSTRKALGPKTTNIDVVNSPKKATKSAIWDDLSSEKKALLKRDQPKESLRERRSENVITKHRTEPTVAIIRVSPEPETPAPPDIFSPPASGSSVVRADSRDTPPPSDLGHGNEGHRPSRRARASVSYAEPNLRDKMRRPTKEFVDAVTGDGKAQRLSSVKLENDAPTIVMKIKEEPEADDAWKRTPPLDSVSVYSKSPLGDKTANQDVLSESMLTQRQRRRSSMHRGGENEPLRSGSSSAISALLSGSKKVKQEPHGATEQKESSLDKAMAKLDIYEFTGSSPREVSDSKIPTVRLDWRPSRSARRLSSLMQDPGISNPAVASDGEHREGATSTAPSRRRQSMMGAEDLVSDTDTEDHRSETRRSSNHPTLSENGEGSTRRERASARRRSMML